MKRTLSAVEARKRLGEILEGVYYRGDEVVIERAGKPMAVVLPMDRYEVIERARERFFELMSKSWDANKDVPLEQIERDVDEAVGALRTERRKIKSPQGG
jgi:prevent-host-death family protein